MVDKNLTSVEGNASVCQVYPVSRVAGEGRAEFLRAWGPQQVLVHLYSVTPFISYEHISVQHGCTRRRRGI